MAVVINEGVVFLRSTLGEGLEPVGHVGHPVLEGPGLDAFRNSVRSLAVKRFALVDALEESVEGVRVEILVHLGPVEHKFAEILRRPSLGSLEFQRLLFEGFFYQF